MGIRLLGLVEKDSTTDKKDVTAWRRVNGS